MFKYALNIAKKSIFPIFGFGPQGQHSVLGTGFSISDDGYFLTANHVIQSIPKDFFLGYLGNIPYCTFTKKTPIAIDIVHQNKELDLAIGKVSSDFLPPLKISKQAAALGESILLCGYPMPMISLKSSSKDKNKLKVTLDVTTVRQYWQPTMKMDSIKVNEKQYKSFIVQHPAFPGMSGGPILDVEANVVGITLSNWTRQIQRIKGISPINVENGIGIEIDEIKKFLYQSPYFKNRVQV